MGGFIYSIILCILSLFVSGSLATANCDELTNDVYVFSDVHGQKQGLYKGLIRKAMTGEIYLFSEIYDQLLAQSIKISPRHFFGIDDPLAHGMGLIYKAWAEADTLYYQDQVMANLVAQKNLTEALSDLEYFTANNQYLMEAIENSGFDRNKLHKLMENPKTSKILKLVGSLESLLDAYKSLLIRELSLEDSFYSVIASIDFLLKIKRLPKTHKDYYIFRILKHRKRSDFFNRYVVTWRSHLFFKNFEALNTQPNRLPIVFFVGQRHTVELSELLESYLKTKVTFCGLNT